MTSASSTLLRKSRKFPQIIWKKGTQRTWFGYLARRNRNLERVSNYRPFSKKFCLAMRPRSEMEAQNLADQVCNLRALAKQYLGL